MMWMSLYSSPTTALCAIGNAEMAHSEATYISRRTTESRSTQYGCEQWCHSLTVHTRPQAETTKSRSGTSPEGVIYHHDVKADWPPEDCLRHGALVMTAPDGHVEKWKQELIPLLRMAFNHGISKC